MIRLEPIAKDWRSYTTRIRYEISAIADTLQEAEELEMVIKNYIERKDKESGMEDYKLRMVKEYKELKDKYDKLYAMLVKYDAGKLDFTPTCPIDLLRKQASVMGQYLYILETRAVIENVDLDYDSRCKAEE